MLLVTLFWSATFVLIKLAISDISSMLFIAFRFTIALFLLALFKWKIISREIKHINFPLILLGILLFVAFSSQTVGLKYTLATKSAFITGSSVVMIPIIQALFEKQFPSKYSLAGVSIVFTGIIFLAAGGNSLDAFVKSLGEGFNKGDMLTLICAFSYALYVVYLDYTSKKYSFWMLLFTQFFVMSVLSFATAGLFSLTGLERLHVEPTGNLISAVIYTSIFATLITVYLQTKYQKLISPTKAGIVFSFEPVFAAFIAFFALSEKIGNFGYIGSALIFIGLLISEVREKK
jgi:drug/metabolite transporter (DMT)-like permease